MWSPFPSHHRLGMVKLGQGKWIVGTPTLDIYADDLSGQGITPLVRNAPFPVMGRPIFAFGALTPAELGSVRARAR